MEDGEVWRSLFGPLAERFDDITADFMRPMLRVPDHPLLMARFGAYSALPAALLARRWSTPKAQALFAGVAAHALRPFSTPMSSAIGVALRTAAHRYGWPVAEGGSAAISRAMMSLLEEHGASFETGVRVTSLDELDAPDIVMLDVAPAAAARGSPRGWRPHRHGQRPPRASMTWPTSSVGRSAALKRHLRLRRGRRLHRVDLLGFSVPEDGLEPVD